MLANSTTKPTGDLSILVKRNFPRTSVPSEEMSIKDMTKFATPNRKLDSAVNRWRASNAMNFARGLKAVALAKALKLPHFYGRLSLVHVAKDGSWVDLGLVGLRLVTDNGVAFIVDGFDNTVELEIMNYHGIGTSGTAENQTDSALGTELTTQYQTDNTRATGTQSQPSANIYQSVGTNTVDSAVGIQEHGMFSTNTSGTGVLLDRTVFTTVNLGNGDSLQSTYQLTISAGG